MVGSPNDELSLENYRDRMEELREEWIVAGRSGAQQELVALHTENADLLLALVGLTDMGRTPKGHVIVGPHGWKLAQDTLAKYRC